MTDAAPANFTYDPTNPLEVALYEGMTDPSTMHLFEQLMLQVDLYAVPDPQGPGGAIGDDGPKVLKENEQLILRGVVLNDGRNTVTVFTDPRRCTQMYGEDARILAMNGRNLLNILRDTVILLNPSDGRGLILEPDQIKAVLELPEAPAPVYRPSGEVTLTAPPEDQIPTALVERLAEAFKPLPVKAAWLAHAHWTEIGVTGLYLDVRTEGPPQDVRNVVQRAVRGLVFNGAVFDVAIGEPGGPDGAGLRIV